MRTHTALVPGVRFLGQSTAIFLLAVLVISGGVGCGGSDDGKGSTRNAGPNREVSAVNKADKEETSGSRPGFGEREEENQDSSEERVDAYSGPSLSVQNLVAVPDGEGPTRKAGQNQEASTVNDADREENSGSRPGFGEQEEKNQDSSEERVDVHSGPSLSVQNLVAVPGGEYKWIGMLDAQAFVSGDPPREIMAIFGLFDVGKILDDALDNRGEELEISHI